MKKNFKKGFTIVELVIVIAVIAILSAVLIPTFSSVIRKAKMSNDTQLIRNLNISLKADEAINGKPETMHEALEITAGDGYDVAKINASAVGNEILWDGLNNVFCYFNGEKIEYIPENSGVEETPSNLNYWVISNTISEKYSTYYTGSETIVNTSKGFDVGKSGVTEINYTNEASAQTVVIRTNGGTLNVNAPNDTVIHYGEANVVDISAVASNSYHEFGSAVFTKIEKGRYVVENTGVSKTVVVTDATNVTIVDSSNKIEAKYEVSDQIEIESIKQGSTLFAGGKGTEADPYLIENAYQIANVGSVYNEGFKYFRVKDGIETIDCNGWKAVDFNGNFDGNGVKLINVTDRLFNRVGKNESATILIRNFEVTMNFVSSSHAAMIKEIDNFGTTTFENVKIHGYIEGESNVASLFSFGTNNGHETGSNYTVELKNVVCDATIVCTTANTIGTFVAHAYAGNNNKLTLKVDDSTAYLGTIYSAGGKCNEYVAIGTYEIVKGEEVITQSQIKVETIKKVNAVKGEAGCTVEVQNNVSKVVVGITSQLTAYDENNEKIAKLAGITMTLSTTEIVDGINGTIKVLDVFNSAEIVNNASEYNARIENGVLKAYIAQNSNYKTGYIRLQVNQYDANGNLVACGTINLIEIK